MTGIRGAYCYNGPVPRLLALLLLLALPAAAPGAEGPASLRGAVRYGLLWLEVEPLDAHVALDGEYLDRGVWLISLAPGLHDVEVRKDGFRPLVRKVGIGPGESLRLALRLEPDARESAPRP